MPPAQGVGRRWLLSAKGCEGALWSNQCFYNLTVVADYTGVTYMPKYIIKLYNEIHSFCVSYLNKVGYQKKRKICPYLRNY